jgi:hypothetical protein
LQVWFNGWDMMVGGPLTVSFATPLVALPAMFVTITMYSPAFVNCVFVTVKVEPVPQEMALPLKSHW